jgi:very-short-patch-repair endonuclease
MKKADINPSTPKQRARSLRKAMTDAERLLWQHLRRRQLAGWKFRRQHAVGPFIVDFVCVARKLIVEVDGGQHASDVGQDEKRSRYLSKEGYRILRFWNNDVLKEIDGVLEIIARELSG